MLKIRMISHFEANSILYKPIERFFSYHYKLASYKRFNDKSRFFIVKVAFCGRQKLKLNTDFFRKFRKYYFLID